MDSIVAFGPGFAGTATLADTPAVLVDEQRLAAGIEAMQRRARIMGVALHPHVKTHKSLEIARRQLAAGAAGLTASKPAEAEVFLRAGLGPVTVAYPLLRAEPAARVLAAAGAGGVAARFVVDSPAGLSAVAEAASAVGAEADTFVEVDVGLRRCGVDPASPEALALVEMAALAPGVRFAGLFSHAGHAYAAGNPDRVKAVAAAELATLAGLRARIESRGIKVAAVSVGSTPTVIANAGFEGVTEIRPGNYVFLDLTAIRLGIAERRDLSLAVLATVVSLNAEHAIVDAGSKTLSSDLGPHGTSASGHGEAWPLAGGEPFAVTRLSEEHGFLARNGRRLALGERLLILPNHACPVANLARELVLCGEEGIRRVPVDAHGTSQGSGQP